MHCCIYTYMQQCPASNEHLVYAHHLASSLYVLRKRCQRLLYIPEKRHIYLYTIIHACTCTEHWTCQYAQEQRAFLNQQLTPSIIAENYSFILCSLFPQAGCSSLVKAHHNTILLLGKIHRKLLHIKYTQSRCE